jgi:hypothetical protein
VQNAVEILKTGELLSRGEAARRGTMRHDNASSQVIAATSASHREFARLYFRPRTPTQFHNEGIRPPNERKFDNAHCPVPVFFGFDLVETLVLDGVLFSDGNMAASNVLHGDSSTLFGRIPFDLVYHEGPIDNALRARNVIHHRHAEVLAPRSLGLATLRWVGCRSHAERETLLWLLGSDRMTWEKRISVAPERLFLKLGCLVESVTLTSTDSVQIALHIPNAWSVRIRFELRSEQSAKKWSWSSGSWSSRVLALRMHGLEPGVLRVFIEDCLAYESRIQPAEEPF